MQTVSSAWTAEERDVVRKVAHNLMMSWKKDTNLGSVSFTIGVSIIGGNDSIGINPGALGGPNIYNYFDETEYVTSLGWERGLSMPTGGLNMAMAEAELDNTSGRFTPRHMGGNSELFTAILPRRPMIINAGFNFAGIDQTVPQFAGVLDRSPAVDTRNRSVSLQASDYVNFFKDRFLDQTIMFTGQRTDQVLATLFEQQGMSTAQYDLDYGINIIPFGLFETGVRFSEVIHKLVEAENGQFYQDEEGVFRFENRQHWDSSPHTQVQRIVLTSQVINATNPGEDHIVNVVEVKGTPRQKEQNQLVWQSTGFAGSGEFEMAAGSHKELWVSFDDPLLEIDTPVSNGTVGQTSFYVANAASDGSGVDLTSSVSIKSIAKFSNAAKIVFSNNGSVRAFLTNLDIWGRPARRSGDVYFRSERGLSVTAYEERTLVIENEFIQSQDWARSYGEMIIQDFAFPENLQTLTVKAMPSLQLGDLVSWQGRHWRIYGIRTKLSPGEGFVQELDLLQRDINSYFRIGISVIGSSDQIAP